MLAGGSRRCHDINESFFFYSGGGHQRLRSSKSSAARQQIGFIERRAIALVAYGTLFLSAWMSSTALFDGFRPVCTTTVISHFELLLFLSRGAILAVRDGLLCIDIGVTADILWLSAFGVIAFFWVVVIARRI
jgi:hypothetical protein